MTTAVPVLSTEALTAGYRSEPVIFDIDSQFHPGEITALIGTNGAGKSTFLKTLFGLTTISQGTIRVDGKEITPEARTLVELGISYVPQLQNVFPGHTVKTNLEIGAYVRSGKTISDIVDVFPALGSLMKVTSSKLSGGQRNMLAVGRALMSDPRVLLLDEPTGGLAPNIAVEFWDHLHKLRAANVCIIAVEQNVNLALSRSDRAYLLGRGSVVLSGSAKEMAARSDFESLFLEQGEPAGKTNS